jgi:peptidyl-prolyl cis-trans isomerase A (cyclophilin A)
MSTGKSLSLVFVIVSALLLCGAICAQDKKDSVSVIIRTELGDIEVEIFTVQAPVTSANFLEFVKKGYYDGGRFHRSVTMDNQPNNKVKIEVVQAGIDPSKETEKFTPIALERTNQTGLRHRDGTISLARSAPDTAISDFFICIGDQPSLDYGGQRNPDGQGFAAFGRVTRGLDIVRKIQSSPADGQKLSPPIKILRIRLKG